MAATLKVPTVFTAVDKFSSVIRTMTKGVRTWSNKSIAAVRRFDQKITKSFKKLGRFAQIGLGLGIGLIFREGLTAITDFETGLIGVGKTTGLAGKELKDLGFDILKLSKKLKTISSVKLLEFAQAAGQMGINSSKDILNFSSTLAQLEKTTDILGAEGAQSIARLLEVVGEGPGVVVNFGSAIVALGNSSKATESQILAMSTRVGQSTSAFDLSSAEVLGLSTTLVQLGFKAEAAGTVMGKVFRRIELATIKGGEELNNFAKIMKLTPKKVQEAFKASPKKAFDLLIKGFGEIKKEGGSVQKAMLSVGLSGDRLGAVIPLLAGKFELLAEKTKLAKKAFKENMALQREFAESQKTVTSALNTVVFSFKNLLTAEALQGSKLQLVQKALFFVADNMSTIITVIAILIGSFITMKAIIVATTVVTTLYSVGLGIMSALSGTASIAIGKNVIAMNAYKIALGISTAAQWLFNIAMSANPIVLIIIAVIAAIAAIVFAFKNWDSITAWFAKQWQKFTSFISDAWGRIVSFFKEFDFKAFFKNIGQSILAFLFTPMKGLLGLLSKIPGKIGKIASMGLEKIGEITGQVDVEDNTEKNPALQSPEIASNKQLSENIQKNNISIDVRDPGNNIENIESKGDLDIPIKLTGTQGVS